VPDAALQQDAAEMAKFVVGLGNPGDEYAPTRHNLGYMVLEALAARWNVGRGRRMRGAQVLNARVPGPGRRPRRVVLVRPQEYMNRSGKAVRDVAAFYRVERQNMLIVLDDMALGVGRLRCRAGGSAGGHKGLADVVAALGGEDVPRLRIGIGSPPNGMDGADFVLQPFNADEREMIRKAIELAAQAVEDWVFKGIEYVMERYNRKEDN